MLVNDFLFLQNKIICSVKFIIRFIYYENILFTIEDMKKKYIYPKATSIKLVSDYSFLVGSREDIKLEAQKKQQEIDNMVKTYEEKYHINLIRKVWAVKYPAAIYDFVDNYFRTGGFHKFNNIDLFYRYNPNMNYSLECLLDKLYNEEFLMIYKHGEAYFKYKQQEAYKQYEIQQYKNFLSLKSCLHRYVLNMHHLSNGHKYIYERDYYPFSKYITLNPIRNDNRKEVWRLCGEAEDGSRLTPYQITTTQSRIAFWLAKKINDTFGEDSKELTLVCFPPQTKRLYIGMKYFFEKFCEHSKIKNGYDYLDVKDAIPITHGGTGKRTVVYKKEKLRYKHIVLFVPLLQEESEVINVIEELENYFCDVVLVLAHGKDITYTYH